MERMVRPSLHARAGNGAAMFLCQRIQPVNRSGGGGPGIDRFLACGNHVNAPGNAFLYMLINIPNKAKEGNYRHIGIAAIQHLVRVV